MLFRSRLVDRFGAFADEGHALARAHLVKARALLRLDRRGEAMSPLAAAYVGGAGTDPETAAAALLEIGRLTFEAPSGGEQPYLTAEEVQRLSIPKGSLSHAEREEIESHVTTPSASSRRSPGPERSGAFRRSPTRTTRSSTGRATREIGRAHV